jgi:hypothetical protein
VIFPKLGFTNFKDLEYIFKNMGKSEKNVSKRDLLWIGTGMIPLVAGCSGFSGSPGTTGSNENSDPTSVVRDYLKAVENGEFEEAMQFVHPEGEFEQRAEQQVDAGNQAEFQEITVETLEQDEESALVMSEIVTRDGGARQRMYLELVLDNKEWLIHREVQPQDIDSEHLPEEDLTIEQRVQDVTPGDSFEVYVGPTDDATELFFEATDVSEVWGLGEESDYAYVRVDFSSEQGKEMEDIITNINSSNIIMVQYLDGEEIVSTSLSRNLITLIRDGLWAEDSELSLTYDDLETAERVAATILDLTDDV